MSEKNMNVMVPFRAPAGSLSRMDPQFKRRLSLFSKTVGKDLVGAEIDEAIEWCEIYGANPFTKDIYFFVFDADKPARRVVPVLSIGLYRKIAARTKCYRPDDKPARFTYDESIAGPTNPRGIVSCEVSVYQFAQGAWWPVAESVRWEERAPIKLSGSEGEKWVETGEVHPPGHKRAGQPKMRRVPVGDVVPMLDPNKPNWKTMPETMLSKCAEAAAIRKAFPNEVAGSYVEGELDAAHTMELTATEIIDREGQVERITRIGADKSIMVSWGEKDPLQRVPVGKFHDEVMAFIAKNTKKGEEEYVAIANWRVRNREALNDFWAYEKDAALSLKQELDRIEAKAKADEAPPK